MDLPSFMKAFTDETAYAQVRAQFVAQVKPLIENGAEVIIPAGGLPMLLFARESPFVIDDAPVLNGIAIVAKATEMAISLRSITNLVVSRRGTYAKAPAAAISRIPGAAALTRVRVLVLGGTGVFGSRLCRLLAGRPRDRAHGGCPRSRRRRCPGARTWRRRPRFRLAFRARPRAGRGRP